MAGTRRAIYEVVPTPRPQEVHRVSPSRFVRTNLGQNQLDAVRGTDVAYLRCGAGWAYLGAIRDGHSRCVLRYCVGSRQDLQLVMTATGTARELCRELPRQVVRHADHGTQSTSHQLH